MTQSGAAAVLHSDPRRVSGGKGGRNRPAAFQKHEIASAGARFQVGWDLVLHRESGYKHVQEAKRVARLNIYGGHYKLIQASILGCKAGGLRGEARQGIAHYL